MKRSKNINMFLMDGEVTGIIPLVPQKLVT